MRTIEAYLAFARDHATLASRSEVLHRIREIRDALMVLARYYASPDLAVESVVDAVAETAGTATRGHSRKLQELLDQELMLFDVPTRDFEPRSSQPNDPQRMLVVQLAHFYKDQHGKLPRRSHDSANSRDTGAFLNLVNIVNDVLPPEHRLQGPADVVRDVLLLMGTDKQF